MCLVMGAERVAGGGTSGEGLHDFRESIERVGELSDSGVKHEGLQGQLSL